MICKSWCLLFGLCGWHFRERERVREIKREIERERKKERERESVELRCVLSCQR